MPTAYDRVPYPGGCHATTHPQHLAALARLRGLDPCPPSQARVLEIGCAMGRNLAPIAESLPGAECVGVDSSAVQVAAARALGEGLGNLRVLCADITSPGLALGEFDYILCHGVYSWVPPEVQRGLLGFARQALRPQGVLYLSTNSLPGWHLLRLVRDLTRLHAGAFEDPGEQVQQARAALAFAAEALAEDPSPYAALVRHLNRDLCTRDDAYVFHEHLAPFNEALYLGELVQRAEAAGLGLLTDAEPGSTLTEAWPGPVAATLRHIGGGQVQTETLMDFLRGRTFRRSVFTRAEQAPDPHLRPEALRGLWVGVPALLRGQEEVEIAGTTLHVPDPLARAGLALLGEVWPGTLPFEALQAQVRAREGAAPDDEARLGGALLGALVHAELTLRLEPEPWAARLPERPRAPRVARSLAGEALQVASWAHRPVALTEPVERALLPLLDGTRDRDALRAAALAPPGEVDTLLGRWLDARLLA